MSGETELDIPEIVVMLVHPLNDAGLSADIDWTADARGSVTLSFCGVKAFAEEDCKTAPSHMRQNMFPYQEGDGPIETRTFYRFAARTIRVPHGTAADPERAPHGLILKFNIRGCLPESEKLLFVEKRMPMSNQLQAVVTATLRYPQLYETATAAERNQPLVVATHQRVGGTVYLHETCDLVYQLHTQSPENADCTAVMSIGIHHDPDARRHAASMLAARALKQPTASPSAKSASGSWRSRRRAWRAACSSSRGSRTRRRRTTARS